MPESVEKTKMKGKEDEKFMKEMYSSFVQFLNDEGVYRCQLCDEKFEVKKEAISHLIIHKGAIGVTSDDSDSENDNDDVENGELAKLKQSPEKSKVDEKAQDSNQKRKRPRPKSKQKPKPVTEDEADDNNDDANEKDQVENDEGVNDSDCDTDKTTDDEDDNTPNSPMRTRSRTTPNPNVTNDFSDDDSDNEDDEDEINATQNDDNELENNEPKSSPAKPKPTPSKMGPNSKTGLASSNPVIEKENEYSNTPKPTPTPSKMGPKSKTRLASSNPAIGKENESKNSPAKSKPTPSKIGPKSKTRVASSNPVIGKENESTNSPAKAKPTPCKIGPKSKTCRLVSSITETENDDNLDTQDPENDNEKEAENCPVINDSAASQPPRDTINASEIDNKEQEKAAESLDSIEPNKIKVETPSIKSSPMPKPSESKSCQHCLKHFSKISFKKSEQEKHVDKCDRLHPFVMNGSCCKFCKRTFQRIGQLFEHLEMVHLEKIGEYSQQIKFGDDGGYNCIICDTIFPTKVEVYEHIDQHISAINQSKAIKRKAESEKLEEPNFKKPKISENVGTRSRTSSTNSVGSSNSDLLRGVENIIRRVEPIRKFDRHSDDDDDILIVETVIKREKCAEEETQEDVLSNTPIGNFAPMPREWFLCPYCPKDEAKFETSTKVREHLHYFHKINIETQKVNGVQIKGILE